ncbi:MAG: nuclear transport factor 2 family protein [Bacteroidota bacterium]
MKPFFIILVFIALGFFSCQNDEEPNKKALLLAIEKFNTAFAQGDLSTLDSMTTANYLHTNSSSKVIGKTDWFNYLNKRSASLESGEINVLRYELDQTKIEYHGPSAIVTGRVTVVVQDNLGTNENQYRITNLWVYEDGIWKRAGFHDGKIQ